MSAGPARNLPSDACPYRKPFPPGFRECPAHQPSDFVALDTQYQVLGAVRSCVHLEVGSLGAGAGGFYPRCRLGDAADRESWAAAVRRPRLEKLTAFRISYGIFAAPHMEALWAAKGRQLEAFRAGDRNLQVVRRREVDEMVAAFLIEMDRFFEAHQSVLDELGLPLQASRTLFRAAFEHWKTSSLGSSDYQVPEEVLASFPEPARILLQPRSTD